MIHVMDVTESVGVRVFITMNERRIVYMGIEMDDM
tara:strand:+ start:409 stop:513 length:105 start_codon:yes stop_codon:yes gene_type:complete